MMDGNSLTTVNLTREFATLWILQGNRTIKSTGLCGVSNIVCNECFQVFPFGAAKYISHGSCPWGIFFQYPTVNNYKGMIPRTALIAYNKYF